MNRKQRRINTAFIIVIGVFCIIQLYSVNTNKNLSRDLDSLQAERIGLEAKYQETVSQLADTTAKARFLMSRAKNLLHEIDSLGWIIEDQESLLAAQAHQIRDLQKIIIQMDDLLQMKTAIDIFENPDKELPPKTKRHITVKGESPDIVSFTLTKPTEKTNSYVLYAYSMDKPGPILGNLKPLLTEPFSLGGKVTAFRVSVKSAINLDKYRILVRRGSYPVFAGEVEHPTEGAPFIKTLHAR